MDLVEIRHREHRARRDEAGADRVRDGRLVRAQDRAVGESLARERDDVRRRPARTCVVVGEQGEQQLLALVPARGSTRTRSSRWAASRWSPGANRPFVIRPAARNRSGLGIGPGKLVERLLEHGVRLLSAEDEQLAAEQSRGLGAPHRARGQRMRLAQVLYCGLRSRAPRPRRFLEEHFGLPASGGGSSRARRR